MRLFKESTEEVILFIFHLEEATCWSTFIYSIYSSQAFPMVHVQKREIWSTFIYSMMSSVLFYITIRSLIFFVAFLLALTQIF